MTPRYLLPLPVLVMISACCAWLPAQAQDAPQGMRLGNIIAHVSRTDPALLSARAALDATKELYPQAAANWRPTMNAESSIYATNIDTSNFSNGDGATTKDLTLSLNQPIYRGGQTTASIERAKLLIDAAQQDLRNTEQNVYLETAITYMNVVRDSAVLSLRQTNESLLGQEVTAARERFKGGEITVTDVQQAEARLARAKADHMNASGNYASSVAAFKEKIGLPLPDIFYYPTSSLALPATLDQALMMLDKDNPALHAAQFEYDAALKDVRRIKGELYPQLAGFASFNKQYDPQPGIIADSQTETIGLRANLALYEGGAVRSPVREASSRAQSLQHDIGDVRRNLRAGLIGDWKTLESARGEIASRQLEITAAKEAAEGVRAQADMGERTMLERLEADQDVLEAETSLVEARRNKVIAEYSIAARLGLLVLDREK